MWHCPRIIRIPIHRIFSFTEQITKAFTPGKADEGIRCEIKSGIGFPFILHFHNLVEPLKEFLHYQIIRVTRMFRFWDIVLVFFILFMKIDVVDAQNDCSTCLVLVAHSYGIMQGKVCALTNRTKTNSKFLKWQGR
jgi:hypothetical protein